jgi:hypothetical protein
MVVSAERVRRLALALPGAAVQEHHGRPSFRVAGRIFATLWDARHLNVMLEPARIEALASDREGVCLPVWWGRRLAALQIDLDRATMGLVERALEEAWRRRSPPPLRA